MSLEINWPKGSIIMMIIKNQQQHTWHMHIWVWIQCGFSVDWVIADADESTILKKDDRRTFYIDTDAIFAVNSPSWPELRVPPITPKHTHTHNHTFDPEPDKRQTLMMLFVLVRFKGWVRRRVTMSEVRVMPFVSNRRQSCIFIIFFRGKWDSLYPVCSIFISFIWLWKSSV